MKEKTEALIRTEYLRRWNLAASERRSFGVKRPDYAEVRREVALELAIAGKL